MKDEDLNLDEVTLTLDGIDDLILSDYNITGSSSIDTITLDPSLYNNSLGTISLPSSSYISTSGSTASTYTINNSSVWGMNPGTVNIDTNGISMDEATDIKIGNRSLKEFMEKMEDRLSILVPDPAKLEKFAALKKAYENYKLMERLCHEDDNKQQ